MLKIRGEINKSDAVASLLATRAVQSQVAEFQETQAREMQALRDDIMEMLSRDELRMPKIWKKSTLGALKEQLYEAGRHGKRQGDELFEALRWCSEDVQVEDRIQELQRVGGLRSYRPFESLGRPRRRSSPCRARPTCRSPSLRTSPWTSSRPRGLTYRTLLLTVLARFKYIP